MQKLLRSSTQGDISAVEVSLCKGFVSIQGKVPQVRHRMQYRRCLYPCSLQGGHDTGDDKMQRGWEQGGDLCTARSWGW